MRQEWFANGVMLGYRYDNSPIVVPDGTPAPPDLVASLRADRAARRARAARLARRRPLDARPVRPRLHAAASRRRIRLSGKSIEDAARQRGVPLQSVALAEPQVLDAYERRLVLVRPDGHVAWRADREPDDAGALIDTVRGERISDQTATGSRVMTDKLREKLINAGRVLVDEGQGDYVWGHISARLPDNPNRFLMKPGCVGVEEMTPDNIITVDIEGDKVAGEWPRHNEVFIHSEVLRARPDINCVIHTHPENVVAFSSLGKPLAPISNDGTMFSAGVPVFSETTDLITDQPRGKAVAKTLGQGGILILRNHGLVAAGRTIEEAVFLAVKLEKACRIQMLAEMAGGPKLFVKDEELAAKRARTNRGDSQGNAFSYMVRRWHLRCGCEVPQEYRADLANFDRSGYKGG